MSAADLLRDYECLQEFPERMKLAGSWTRLVERCMNLRETWKQFGFRTLDSQVNLVLAVMLCIREQSARSGECTLADVAGTVARLAPAVTGTDLASSACADLAKFVVQDVLTNSGRRMRFTARDFGTGEGLSL